MSSDFFLDDIISKWQKDYALFLVVFLSVFGKYNHFILPDEFLLIN